MVACMLRSRLLVLVWGVLTALPSTTWGAEHGFEFTGALTLVIPEPYGVTYGRRLPDFSALSGHFVYESNTPSYAIAGCDCKGYIHKQINGLATAFVGLVLQADEYVIQIRNNVNVSGLGPSDILTVLYSDPNGTINPILSTPLLIDGSPVTTGSIRIDLVAPATRFPDASLPTSLNPADFFVNAGTSNFGDGIPIGIDVLFKLQTLSSVTHFTSDHDLDGDVDGRDYLIWQRHAGLTTGNGDANSDFSVDNDDLSIWESQYGSGLPPLAASVAVPEPSAIALLCASLLVCPSRRRRIA